MMHTHRESAKDKIQSHRRRRRRTIFLFYFSSSSPNNNNWAVAGVVTSSRFSLSDCSNTPIMLAHVLDAQVYGTLGSIFRTCSRISLSLSLSYIFLSLSFFCFFFIFYLLFCEFMILHHIFLVFSEMFRSNFMTVLFSLDDDDDVRDDDIEYGSNKNIHDRRFDVRKHQQHIFLYFSGSNRCATRFIHICTFSHSHSLERAWTFQMLSLHYSIDVDIFFGDINVIIIGRRSFLLANIRTCTTNGTYRTNEPSNTNCRLRLVRATFQSHSV